MKAAIDTTVDLEVDLHVHRMHKIAFLHDDDERSLFRLKSLKLGVLNISSLKYDKAAEEKQKQMKERHHWRCYQRAHLSSLHFTPDPR